MSQNQVAAVLEGEYIIGDVGTMIVLSPRSRDAFCLFFDAKTKTVRALNGSGHSPEKLTINHIRMQGITGNKIPITDLNSVTVPGQSIHYVVILPKFL